MNLVHSALAQITNPVLPLSNQSVKDPFGATNTIFQTIISIFYARRRCLLFMVHVYGRFPLD